MLAIIFRLESEYGVRHPDGRRSIETASIRSWRCEGQSLPAGAIVEAIVPSGPFLAPCEKPILSDRLDTFVTETVEQYAAWVAEAVKRAEADPWDAEFTRVRFLPTLRGPTPIRLVGEWKVYRQGYYCGVWRFFDSSPARTTARRAVARYRAEVAMWKQVT